MFDKCKDKQESEKALSAKRKYEASVVSYNTSLRKTVLESNNNFCHVLNSGSFDTLYMERIKQYSTNPKGSDEDSEHDMKSSEHDMKKNAYGRNMFSLKVNHNIKND